MLRYSGLLRRADRLLLLLVSPLPFLTKVAIYRLEDEDAPQLFFLPIVQTKDRLKSPHPPPKKREKMPSAWTEHLSSFRASHPSKTMKECMIEASACYRKPSSASPSKAAKKSAPKAPPKAAPKTAPKTAPKAAPSSSNPWIAHVQAYRATHACSYAEAMQGAKKTYRALTLNACPSKRSTSLRAVGKSRYRANTYCTWSIALGDDTPVRTHVNGFWKTVLFKNIRDASISDMKQYDLGGREQIELLADPPQTKLEPGVTKIMTGGDEKTRKDNLMKLQRNFPNNTFYYITPELEGMLTLQSCIGLETSAQFFSEFDFKFLVAKGSTDIHLAVVDASNTVIDSDTKPHGEKPEECVEQFLGSEKIREKKGKAAIIFAGASMFNDFTHGMEAPQDTFKEVEPGHFKEFSNIVVEKCTSTFGTPPSVFVGSRPRK